MKNKIEENNASEKKKVISQTTSLRAFIEHCNGSTSFLSFFILAFYRTPQGLLLTHQERYQNPKIAYTG